jgi:hypothetical protein
MCVERPRRLPGGIGFIILPYRFVFSLRGPAKTYTMATESK